MLGESIELFKEIFEQEKGNKNSPTLNFLIASLISSDTIVDAESLQNSKQNLEQIKAALEKANLSQESKDYWQEMIEKASGICQQEEDVYLG